MDSVLRAAGMYFLLLVVLKIAGRRTLLEMNSFDFVLLLIISEATQQALLGNDFSFTGAAISQGIERLEEIKFAILEKNGKISIIPADNQES